MSKDLIAFLANAQIIIITPKSLITQPQREGDQYIMENIFQDISSVQTLRMLNTCRSYLQILYLSDITTSNGIEMDNNYLIGVKVQYPKVKNS